MGASGSQPAVAPAGRPYYGPQYYNKNGRAVAPATRPAVYGRPATRPAYAPVAPVGAYARPAPVTAPAAYAAPRPVYRPAPVTRPVPIAPSVVRPAYGYAPTYARPVAPVPVTRPVVPVTRPVVTRPAAPTYVAPVSYAAPTYAAPAPVTYAAPTYTTRHRTYAKISNFFLCHLRTVPLMLQSHTAHLLL